MARKMWPFELNTAGCAAGADGSNGSMEVMTINGEKPPIEVQVIVWVGLTILLAAVGAFVWLFVIGDGFNYSF